MRLDIAMVKAALFKCGRQYRDIAKQYGIHFSYIYNAVSGKAEPGRKFFGFWARFCRDNNLDFLDFVIFED